MSFQIHVMTLNNYQIKVLAAALMLIDHIGAVFFPDIAIFRIIGRFSFPLFILLLVDGEQYTRDLGQYCLRLLVLGVVSQPLLELLFPSSSWNILFILLLGLLCLRLVKILPYWRLPIWVVAAAMAQELNLDYGAYGIAAIALIHSWRPGRVWWTGWIALHLSLFIVMPDLALSQFPAVLAPLLLQFANHQPGPKARWFYLFYPLHWMALWVLHQWLVA